jgi:hypothetical protein
MPGGFHPYHAGHHSLYNSALKAFPGADVYVAATNDTKTRPFPFAIKEKLAKVAGVAPGHFIQVKSPFQPREITDKFNPEQDVVIFVRSEKDRNESPKPGGTKKDGSPAYFQPYTGKNVEPFGKHAYMAYLPTVEFGPGISSATEIRNAWPKLNDKRKTAMVMSLYPATQKNPKLAANVVKMLDMGMGNELAEGEVVPFKQPSKTLTWQQVPKDILMLANDWFWASEDNSGLAATIDPDGFGNGTANDVKYNAAKLQQKGWTIDFNDEYDGPGEFNLRLTNNRGQNVLLSIEDAQSFTGWAKGTSQYDLEEGPIVKRIVHPNKINIYIKQSNKKSPLLVATDIPYHIFDKYVSKVIEKYPQFKHTDFSFKSSDKINEFISPGGGDDREPDEEILRKLAAQWWNGTEQQMAKAQKTLGLMGWDIGQDESGDDDAGVFVIRVGDEHGDSYIAFNHSELSLDDINEDYLDEN